MNTWSRSVMSLPEQMYQSFRQGRLPKVYPAGAIVHRTKGVVQTLRMRKENLRNAVTKLVRPLAARKAVAITDTKFSGYKATIKGAYIGEYGDELSYKVGYKSQFMRPTMAKITQSIGDVKEDIHVLFMPNATYNKTKKKSLTKPEVLTCAAAVFSERGWFKYDALSEDFSVGVFDDRYKPAAEYPVSGVDNAILDLSYSWKVENKVYPLPLPPGLSFDSMTAETLSGYLSYGGKDYNDPTLNSYIRVKHTVKNRTGGTIRVDPWGFLISVLYDDNRRVSQFDTGLAYPSVDILNGRDHFFGASFVLPDWSYGRIAVAHALNFYKDGMFIYGGGPLWQFEVFRLLLP